MKKYRLTVRKRETGVEEQHKFSASSDFDAKEQVKKILETTLQGYGFLKLEELRTVAEFL